MATTNMLRLVTVGVAAVSAVVIAALLLTTTKPAQAATTAASTVEAWSNVEKLTGDITWSLSRNYTVTTGSVTETYIDRISLTTHVVLDTLIVVPGANISPYWSQKSPGTSATLTYEGERVTKWEDGKVLSHSVFPSTTWTETVLPAIQAYPDGTYRLKTIPSTDPTAPRQVGTELTTGAQTTIDGFPRTSDSALVSLPATGYALSGSSTIGTVNSHDGLETFTWNLTGTPAPQQLRVSPDRARVCPNQDVTFRARNRSGNLVNARWSGGGVPQTGRGTRFTTRFRNHGERTVTARTASGARGTRTITVLENSGRAWTNQFPTSRDTADLAEPFRTNVDNFLAALRGAGLVDATGQANPPANYYRISATRRPAERAYLMHYAWRIARQNLDPRQVPRRAGVDICWAHRNDNGTFNQRGSRRAAEAMVQAYGMRARAALDSNHIRGEAIDITIQWQGHLNIVDGNGQQVLINTLPRSGGEGRSGEGNAQLRQVGASYGVIKGVFPRNPDPPHWSINGG